VDFKRDRVDYWVSKGAQMSERVDKLYAKIAAAPAASVA
jgi:small subunit ribosomal protein S16